MTDQDHRLAFRRDIERSRLANGLKLTALKHSEKGRWQHHDDTANIHAITQERLALLRGITQWNVSKHLRKLVEAGWMAKHRHGHRGQQTEYHYLSPPVPGWSCGTCDPRKVVAKVVENPAERLSESTTFESALKVVGEESLKDSPAAAAPADAETIPPWNEKNSSDDRKVDGVMPNDSERSNDERVDGFTASARTPAEIEQRSKWDVCDSCGNCYGSFAHKVACKEAS